MTKDKLDGTIVTGNAKQNSRFPEKSFSDEELMAALEKGFAEVSKERYKKWIVLSIIGYLIFRLSVAALKYTLHDGTIQDPNTWIYILAAGVGVYLIIQLIKRRVR